MVYVMVMPSAVIVVEVSGGEVVLRCVHSGSKDSETRSKKSKLVKIRTRQKPFTSVPDFLVV